LPFIDDYDTAIEIARGRTLGARLVIQRHRPLDVFRAKVPLDANREQAAGCPMSTVAQPFSYQKD
jgi:hypothetical protein